MNTRTHSLPDIQKRLPTGGELNWLNEKHRCNARRNTVPVMDLVKHHRPSSPENLRALIEAHYTAHACAQCGCKSAGTVEQFASQLFEAQYNEPEHNVKRRYTWDECYAFHYTLFCVAPLRGIAMERAVHHAVETVFRNAHANTAPRVWCIREATQREDVDCAVDLVIERSDADTDSAHTVLGLQVKPDSVLKRKSVMAQNRRKHRTFGAPVLFVMYDQRGHWSPTAPEVVTEAERLWHHARTTAHAPHVDKVK